MVWALPEWLSIQEMEFWLNESPYGGAGDGLCWSREAHCFWAPDSGFGRVFAKEPAAITDLSGSLFFIDVVVRGKVFDGDCL